MYHEWDCWGQLMIVHDKFCLVFFLCLFMFLRERHWIELKRVNLVCVCFIFFTLLMFVFKGQWMYWFKRIAFDLFSFSVFVVFFPFVVVERTMSWLVEQDGVCIVFCLSVFLCLINTVDWFFFPTCCCCCWEDDELVGWTGWSPYNFLFAFIEWWLPFLYVFINCFFLLLILVVVERMMSWLVEQDGARIFLPLSNVCQRQNEKQSAKLTRTIAVLCFRFVFIFLFSSQQHQ